MTVSTMNVSQVEGEWRARGFSFGIWVDPPGQRWENYTHDVDELLMLMEGEIELEIAGQVQYPANGEEIFIPARARHSLRNNGSDMARWLYGYRTRG